MAQFTARFRVRAKDEWSPNKKAVILSATRLAENANMTENQSLWLENDSASEQIVLVLPQSVESLVFKKGSDVLVTFNGPAT